ncbi:MAG: hypothetical protein M1429_01150 [Patescibacteria group bacterium]|nr:hypothetical protein [Patescibacteria group bacterium]
MRSRVLIFCLMICCLMGCSKKVAEEWLIIADNSKSLKPQMNLIKKGVDKVGEDFVKMACTGSNLKMVGFSQVNSAYKHLVLAKHHFVLTVPADISRKEQATKIIKEFGQAIDNVQLVDQSPLLEVVRIESELMPKDRGWRLVMTSDFIQSSSALLFTPKYLASRGNQAIIKDMLAIAPKPKNPPISVTLYWYPGLLAKDQAIDPETHARVRRIFKQFFQAWAGKDCLVEVEPLQE